VALDLVVSVLIVAFSLSLMFFYSARLALTVLLVIPVYGAIYHIANRRNRRTLRQLMEHSADLESQLVESLNSVATIKRFGLERFSNLRTEHRFTTLLGTVYTSATTSIVTGSATEFASRLFIIILLWVGTAQVLDHALTPGELMSCYALVGFLTVPIARLIAMNRTVQDALIASDRLFEIMDLEREATSATTELTADSIGDVQFHDVSFRYGTRIQVFRELSVTFPRWKVTAVVGESGSGKSTLLSLLQNLYPLERGRITIGDVDIQQISNESLRRLVSVVPQQIDLFAGDVIENIAIGDPHPDMARLLMICQRLGVSAFVEQMPLGFHTHLGEKGVALSGGQRQRIAIARALYRDPEILILDEATSSLDSGSERHVHEAIAELRARGKTVIVIAHRLSTVINADGIVVLVQGAVVETGTHSELLARRGQYSRLWEHQFPLSQTDRWPS
jgi:ABC-type bacteriocin/lantibiotic exporter with double-glycine peptidase domain